MVVRAGQAVPNRLLRQAREARNLTQDEVADGLIQLGAGGMTGGLVSAIAQTDKGELEAACQSTIAAMSISKDKRVGPLAQRERQLHARLDR